MRYTPPRSARALWLGALFLLTVAPGALWAADKARSEGTVLVWTGLRANDAACPALVDALRQAGLEARVATTDELCQAAGLDAKAVDLLVLDGAAQYPAAGLDPLDRFLAGGAHLMALGGPILTEPLYRSPRGWLTRKQLAAPQSSPIPITGEAGETVGRDQARATIEPVREPGQVGWKVAIAELKSYHYLTVPLTGQADGALLRFRARGDERTSWLCIELNESDKSRWKAIVPLTADWQDYEISAADLVSYANEKRGRAGDFFHSQQAARLSLGFPASLVGAGPHGYEVAALRWQASDVEPQQWAAGLRFHPELAALRKAFGSSLQPPGTEAELTRCLRFVDAGTVKDRSATKKLEVALGQDVFAALPRDAARQALWLPTVREHNLDLLLKPGKPTHGVFLPSQRVARGVPLLLADGEPVMGLWVHLAGRYAGSRWAVSGLPAACLPINDAKIAQGLARLAQTMIARPMLLSLEPRYKVVDSRARLELVARVAAGRRFRGAVELTATLGALTGGEPQARGQATLELAGSKPHEIVVLQADPAQFDWKHFQSECRLACGGQVCDRGAIGLDVRGVLAGVCEHLVATQRTRGDGLFSGISFVDSRGVRALLAGAEIFSRPEYVRAAMAWGEAMIAAQRPDGGYAMGYGGEACYVADGGEIACGMARLVTYVPAEQRQRYFSSLRAYMGFRDSFRCPGGGIGVGWCLHDYGARPVRPLDKLTKIFAPEQNLYTIGCTLAAASMYAALTGDAKDAAAAGGDARWWLARSQNLSAGAAMESAIWAHHLLPDKDLRCELGEALRTRFLPPLLDESNRWWTKGAGRSVQGLEGLAWCQANLGSDPQVAAALMNAAYQVGSAQSLAGIPVILRKPKLLTADWYYINYAGVSLPELLQPGLARKPFAIFRP